MALEIFQPKALKEACRVLAEREGALPLAGGTDLLSRQERGIPLPPALIYLAGLGLDGLGEEPAGGLRIGALVTHGAIASSTYFKSRLPALSEACASVGSPQVRNLGSLGGNLCNASPAADAATALLALGATLEIAGPGGKRSLPVEDFITGPGRTALGKGEILSAILIPSPAPFSAYLKLGRRKAMEIAVVGVAVALDMEGKNVRGCKISLAAVAPTPLRARQAEAMLTGRELTPQAVSEAAAKAAAECSPISDHRASAEYRRAMVEVLCRRALEAAAQKQEKDLSLALPAFPKPSQGKTNGTFTVNGETCRLDVPPEMLLVDLLRERLGLTGTKKGCGEGECGTCTVLLDGQPVNACLVLAATLEGREISTVEGLAPRPQLHPLQSAFIKEGAVQCGYCTPGMLMSASALLKRNPGADEQEIKEALSGNLCRCTGYKKIIQAVKTAGKELSQ